MRNSILASFLFASLLPAQEEAAITLGSKASLQSQILDEERAIQIYTPESYASGKESYPVLYLLDGPAHALHTLGIIQFLARNDRMPEMIMVAIGNTRRTRDMTENASAEMGGEVSGGGADRFLDFICDELTPWVGERYRTRKQCYLIGHSLGGLFAVYALRTRPSFFDGLIAISPSMQWADQKSVAQTEDWLDSKPETKSRIYMTVGSEGMGLLGGTMKVAGLFSEKAPPGLRWKFVHMPEESHNSVPHRSTYDGLEWIFDGWNLHDPLATYDMGGWEAVEAHYAKVRGDLGYEAETPGSVAMDVIFSMVSTNRSQDALAFLQERDPKRYPVPPMLFPMIGSQMKKNGDAEGELALLRIGLGRFPRNQAIREALENLGEELPPMPEERPAVEVPAEVLATYVGDYRFELGGGAISVSIVDGALNVQFPGQGQVLAKALSAQRFGMPGGDMEVSFSQPEEGKSAAALTVHIGGREFVCEREN
ncbi:MAG: alpha/beta hydrolase-fold protein [Planctomycetota bacterium]|jgi:predicted alpha/beta superfamily hydrolase